MSDEQNNEGGVDQEASQQEEQGQQSSGISAAEVRAMLEEQNKRFEALQQTIAQSQQQQQQPLAQESDNDDVDDDLLYTNPAEYKRRLEERITSKVTDKVTQMTQTQAAQQQELNNTVAQLSSDYPELQNQNSELTKRAVEIASKLDKSVRGTAAGARLAVLEASQQLGLVPVSKRQQVNTDDFNLSASSSGSKPPSSKKSKKVTSEMLAVAEALGRPVSDPEYAKRLEKHVRENDKWGKYS